MVIEVLEFSPSSLQAHGWAPAHPPPKVSVSTRLCTGEDAGTKMSRAPRAAAVAFALGWFLTGEDLGSPGHPAFSLQLS